MLATIVQEIIVEVVESLYIDSCMFGKTQLVKSSSDLGFDIVIIETHIGNRPLYVCAVYRPPNLSLNDTYLMCKTLLSLSGKEILLLGDFNLPGINWITNDIVTPVLNPMNQRHYLIWQMNFICINMCTILQGMVQLEVV